MRFYYYGWRAGAGILGAVAVATATVALSVVTVVVVAVLAGSAGTMANVVRREQRNAAGTPAGARYAAAAAAGALAGVVVAGLVVLLGPAGVALALLLAATSPWVVTWLATRFGFDLPTDPRNGLAGSGPERVVATIDDDEMVERAAWELLDASVYTDDELSRAWRVSFTMVHRVRTPVALERVARVRAAYLDEIQRRNPLGFTRWMAAGARASSDPARYLSATERSRTQDH